MFALVNISLLEKCLRLNLKKIYSIFIFITLQKLGSSRRYDKLIFPVLKLEFSVVLFMICYDKLKSVSATNKIAYLLNVSSNYNNFGLFAAWPSR